MIGALLAAALDGSSLDMICRPVEKYVCQMGSACSGGPVTVIGPIDAWAKIHIKSGRTTYERCDSKGCDSYQAIYAPSGQTLSIEIPGRGAFSKITLNGGWSEVASTGTTLLISFGYCTDN